MHLFIVFSIIIPLINWYPSLSFCFVSFHTEHKPNDEASEFKCWNQAMQVELAALEKIGKWKLDDLPCNVKSIGCIWVCKIKHHVDGSIE